MIYYKNKGTGKKKINNGNQREVFLCSLRTPTFAEEGK